MALGRFEGVAMGEGLKGRGLAEAEDGVKTFGYDGYCLALHGVVDVVGLWSGGRAGTERRSGIDLSELFIVFQLELTGDTDIICIYAWQRRN